MNDTGYMDYTLTENANIGRKNVEASCRDYKVIEDTYKNILKFRRC